jgi:hypothetical protein
MGNKGIRVWQPLVFTEPYRSDHASRPQIANKKLKSPKKLFSFPLVPWSLGPLVPWSLGPLVPLPPHRDARERQDREAAHRLAEEAGGLENSGNEKAFHFGPGVGVVRS